MELCLECILIANWGPGVVVVALLGPAGVPYSTEHPDLCIQLPLVLRLAWHVHIVAFIREFSCSLSCHDKQTFGRWELLFITQWTGSFLT